VKSVRACRTVAVLRGRTSRRRPERDAAIVRRPADRRDPPVAARRLFSRWRLRRGTGWTPQRIAWCALLTAWQESDSRTRQFDEARQFLADRTRWRGLPTSYTGFAEALLRWQAPLAKAIWSRLRKILAEQAGAVFRDSRGYVVLAADGSRFECPRTQANEAALGCAGRPGTTPQLMVTTLYHEATALPFAVCLGPGTDSEQAHLMSLCEELPERTLLIADAGFIHYALCERLLADGHAFLLRVGGNRELLIGLEDGPTEQSPRSRTVWLWPQALRKKSPLRMRLIEIETPDPKTPNVFLLTNLSLAELDDAEAEAYYRRRWGVEVFYRTAKQTLESATLKSRTPALALAEAEWLVLSVLLLGLMAIPAVTAAGTSPERWSAAQTLSVVRRRMRHGHRRGRSWSRCLEHDLVHCRQDEARRRGPKSIRRWPRKKTESPPKPPKVRPATAQQRHRAKQLAATVMIV
jgi:hypothetical protein